MTTLQHPDDFQPAEVCAAENIAHETLDAEFHHGEFFEETEDGPMPDFIRLGHKVVEALLHAGIHIPADLTKENF